MSTPSPQFWQTPPRSDADCAAAIAQARDAGPAGMAHLTLACLWQYGRLAAAQGTLSENQASAKIEAAFTTISRLRDGGGPAFPFEFARYRRPRTYQAPARRLTPVWDQIQFWRELRRLRKFRRPEYGLKPTSAALRYWHNRGLDKKSLAPLLQLVLSFLNPEFANPADSHDKEKTAALLMEIGEWERALAIFDGSYQATELAQVAVDLTRTGRADLARQLLAEQAHLAESAPDYTTAAIANAWAYAGDTEAAQASFDRLPAAAQAKHQREFIIARTLGRFYHQGQTDLTDLMPLLPAAKDERFPREQLHRENSVLRVLLEVGATAELAETLDVIRQTLLSPDWSLKHRLGTAKVAGLLWPYRQQYPDLIHDFVQDLFIASSAAYLPITDWQRVDFFMTVDSFKWFVRHWAGPVADEAAKIARQWARR